MSAPQPKSSSMRASLIADRTSRSNDAPRARQTGQVRLACPHGAPRRSWEKSDVGVSNLAAQPDVVVYVAPAYRSPQGDPPMKYMLMLRHTPGTGPAEGTPEFDAEMAVWGDLMGELATGGALVEAHGLDSEATSTTIRLRDGDAGITDGPFAE